MTLTIMTTPMAVSSRRRLRRRASRRARRPVSRQPSRPTRRARLAPSTRYRCFLLSCFRWWLRSSCDPPLMAALLWFVAEAAQEISIIIKTDINQYHRICLYNYTQVPDNSDTVDARSYRWLIHIALCINSFNLQLVILAWNWNVTTWKLRIFGSEQRVL